MIQRKLKQYFPASVKEVWLIHPEALEVEIWTEPNPPEGALTGDATLESPLLPGFALPLADLFLRNRPQNPQRVNYAWSRPTEAAPLTFRGPRPALCGLPTLHHTWQEWTGDIG
jgi:hypothetical protein